MRLTDAEAAEYSPIRFVSPGAAPSLIVHGDADTAVPMVHAFRSSGDWGTLEAEKGVLVASDGRSRRVAAPVRRDEVTFTGDGWTFKARPGWVVREGSRRGDYEAVRQQP